MKTIGLLGGLSWPSTIEYYTLINQMVAEKLGDYHSAKILLKSVDYHHMKTATKPQQTLGLLKSELEDLAKLNPDCIIICNNSLHKSYDLIKDELGLSIPVFHAVDLTVQHACDKGYKQVLFLATKFTMEDDFFTSALEAKGIYCVIPDLQERDEIQAIQSQLREGVMKEEYIQYFKNLTAKHKDLDAVILACTELPLAITQDTSSLTIVNPTRLQTLSAVEYALFI